MTVEIGDNASRLLTSLANADENKRIETANAKLQEQFNIEEYRRLKARINARQLVAQEKESAHKPIRESVLSINELAKLPRPASMIDGVLNFGSYSILRGRDGTFKSFVALGQALSVAAGIPWIGRSTTKAQVLYVAAEDAAGIAERIDAWKLAHPDVKFADNDFCLMYRPINLFTATELDEFVSFVKEGGYRWVIFDTLRLVSGGADGNSSDMGVVVDNLLAVRAATEGGTVTVLAHTDKGDKDSRGFSGIEDDADTIWATEKGNDEDEFMTLRNTKNKNGRNGFRFHLKSQVSGSSIILVEDDAHIGFSNLIGNMVAGTRKVYDTMKSDPDKAYTVAELEQITGQHRNTVDKALKELRTDGFVKDAGRDGKAMTYLLTADGRADYGPTL